jgi:hypothetical protein
MGVVIDRGAAGVHFDELRVIGDEKLLLAGQGIIQIHDASSYAAGETETPASG